jgi:hypothetical protein
MAAPLGGTRARDPGVATINVRKCQWWDPWEVLMEIRERPPSTRQTSMAGPLWDANGDSKASTINATNINGEPLGPRWGPFSIHDLQLSCDLHGQHR